jgi:hypothetical protein
MKIRDFSTWYRPEDLEILTQTTNNVRKILPHVFLDLYGYDSTKSFKTQLKAVIDIKKRLDHGKKDEYNFCFICKEPGAGANHFIVGALIDNNLVIINPIGSTKHKDFYQILHSFQQENPNLGLVIHISNTEVQHDPQGLASCGPICIELIKHISSLTTTDIMQFTKKDMQGKNKDGFGYQEFNAIDLLPISLKQMLEIQGDNYTKHVLDIREKHASIIELSQKSLSSFYLASEIKKIQAAINTCVTEDDLRVAGSAIDVSAEDYKMSQSAYLIKNILINMGKIVKPMDNPISSSSNAPTLKGQVEKDTITDEKREDSVSIYYQGGKKSYEESSAGNPKTNIQNQEMPKNAFNQQNNPGYQYQATDITLIQRQIMQKYFAGFIIHEPIGDNLAVQPIFQRLIDSLDTLKPTLCIYNLGNYHWVTFAALKKPVGIIVLYKDSLGNSNYSFEKQIQDIDGTTQVIAHSGREQISGAECGIFALQNMQIIANELVKDKDGFINNFPGFNDFCSLSKAKELRKNSFAKEFVLGKEQEMSEELVKASKLIQLRSQHETEIGTIITTLKEQNQEFFEKYNIKPFNNKLENEINTIYVDIATSPETDMKSNNYVYHYRISLSKDLKTNSEEIAKNINKILYVVNGRNAAFNQELAMLINENQINIIQKNPKKAIIEEVVLPKKVKLVELIDNLNLGNNQSLKEETQLIISLKDALPDGFTTNIRGIIGDYFSYPLSLLNARATEAEPVDEINQMPKTRGNYAQYKKESINYVQIGEDLPILSYTANKPGEVGHPDANGKLSKIVNEVLGGKGVKTLIEFHAKVYELLWKEPEFQKKAKYSFKYKFSYKETRIDIGESDNLLFWLLAYNKPKNALSIIKNYNFDISSILDNKGNNILHISALYGIESIVTEITTRYFCNHISSDQFTQLINHRNYEGTNPLGMVFLSNVLLPGHMNIVKSITSNDCYNINAYLNNKNGMDYTSPKHLQQIGGYNLLHMAIRRGKVEIIELLGERNSKKYLSDTERVDFMYPTLNPSHHMISPTKLADIVNFTSEVGASTREIIQNSLETQRNKQVEFQASDDSGDSDVEDKPAWHYKQGLLTLKDFVSKPTKPQHGNLFSTPTKSSGAEFDKALKKLNSPSTASTPKEKGSSQKEYDKIVIPLFHGVPFIQGQYTNNQKREVAKKFLGFNKKFIDSVNKTYEESDVDSIIKSIHSRTATASCGIENLYALINAPKHILTRLKGIEEYLKGYLLSLKAKHGNDFLASIKKYIYEFADNPIKGFWEDLVDAIPPDQEIVKYRFPVISTSKAPDHAVKFGFGGNVEATSRGEAPVYPNYNDESYPMHRLAGFLYVTLHSAKELQGNGSCALDITQLLKTQQLKTAAHRTDNQIEVIFLGGIDGKVVTIVIPLLYPNLDKEYDPEYHGIFGITNTNSRLATHYPKVTNEVSGLVALDLRDEASGFSPKLMQAYVQFALKVADAIAQSQGKVLCTILPNGMIVKCPMGIDDGGKLSVLQIMQRDYIVPTKSIKSKNSGESKKKISPTELDDKLCYEFANLKIEEPHDITTLTKGVATLEKKDNGNKAISKPVARGDLTTTNFVTGIIYDNELLNHPDLLKKAIKLFGLNKTVDLSSYLSQELIDLAIFNNDPDILIGGMISLLGSYSDCEVAADIS